MASDTDQDKQARIARIREELRRKGKLKHRPGPHYCVVCGIPTACEWFDLYGGPDRPRWPACPEDAAYLHHYPEERAALLPSEAPPAH